MNTQPGQILMNKCGFKYEHSAWTNSDEQMWFCNTQPGQILMNKCGFKYEHSAWTNSDEQMWF